jgi:hypothetical protein
MAGECLREYVTLIDPVAEVTEKGRVRGEKCDKGEGQSYSREEKFAGRPPEIFSNSCFENWLQKSRL